MPESKKNSAPTPRKKYWRENKDGSITYVSHKEKGKDRTKIKERKYIMFIQSKAASSNAHKDGLCIAQRRGGKETLVQWENGDQQWCHTQDLQGNIVLMGRPEYEQ